MPWSADVNPRVFAGGALPASTTMKALAGAQEHLPGHEAVLGRSSGAETPATPPTC